MSQRRHLVILLFLATLLFLWELGLSLRTAEGHWTAITQHMYQSGDIFVMQIGSRDYYEKPYLSYWLQLICAKIAGGVTEPAARFPSVLAALASLVLTYVLARKMFSAQVGLTAAAMLLTTPGFIYWAKNAQVEMLNVLAIQVIIWMFFVYKTSPRVGWFYLMACLMAVGSWLKGPLCYTVPGMVIVLYSLVFWDWKWLRIGHTIGAALLSLLLYFSVFAIAWKATGRWDALYMVYRENVLRLFAPFDQVKPFYYYFYAVPGLMLPWSILLPWGIWYLASRWHEVSRPTKEVLVMVAGIFLFFSLTSSKRDYYLLPILPFCSIFLAQTLHLAIEMADGWKKSIAALWAASGVIAQLPLLALVLLHVGLAGQLASHPSLAAKYDMDKIVALLLGTRILVLALIVSVAGITMIILSRQAISARHIVISLGCVYAVCWGYYNIVLPQTEDLRGRRAFVQAICDMVPPDKTLAFFPDQQTILVYYLQFHHRLGVYQAFGDVEKARQWALATGGFLIAEGDRMPDTGWKLLAQERDLKKGKKNLPMGLYRPDSK